MKKLTKKDKEGIRLALYLAIEYERSYLASIRIADTIPDKKWKKELEQIVERTKQNITNFKRIYALFTD